MNSITELLASWETAEGEPLKGDLIDISRYKRGDLSCMCAQGQLLYVVGKWSAERLTCTSQGKADTAVARLLNISRGHAILLRKINDQEEGSPALVLTDPSRIIGRAWNTMLDFWWYLDELEQGKYELTDELSDNLEAFKAASNAARYATGWSVCWSISRQVVKATTNEEVVLHVVSGATWELLGARTLRELNLPFVFLPMLGFESPEALPARPVDYGTINLKAVSTVTKNKKESTNE